MVCVYLRSISSVRKLSLTERLTKMVDVRTFESYCIFQARVTSSFWSHVPQG